MEMKKFDYMLEIDILRNSSPKFWVSWGVLFKGLGVQKNTQTPCWQRPWYTVLVYLNKTYCSRYQHLSIRPIVVNIIFIELDLL